MKAKTTLCPVLACALALALCLVGALAFQPAQAQAKAKVTTVKMTSGKVKYSKIAKQYFTGSALRPAVTVKFKARKLKKGTYYKVSYSKNKAVGTAKVTFKAKKKAFKYKGKKYRLTGKKTIKFKIRKADTSYSLNKFSGAPKSDVAAANAPASLVRELDTSTRIVDLSIWDGAIDWSKAHSKLDVAFLRSYVTYREHKHYLDGKKMLADENYDAYATGCEEYHVPYAAYGYLIFTNSTDSLAKAKKDARAQAKKLWNASFSNGHKPLYLILDIEDSNMGKKNPTRVVQCLKTAINKIQKLALANGYGNGLKIGLYIGNNVYKKFGFTTTAGQKALDEKVDFIWIPTYGKNTGSIPTKYAPSYACDLWQYTSAGTISGISGKVDESIVNTVGPNAHSIAWYKKR